MFVITADQVDSRTHEDLAGAARARINRDHGSSLLLPADRNAGDEIQMLTDDAATALQLALELTRDGDWSVGLGLGDVRRPLPAATREASGGAFFAARNAVDNAKKARTRFALRAEGVADCVVNASDVEALIDLVMILRARRTPAGWELYDLLRTGITQQDAATQLSISAPAASARAQAAQLKAENASIPALTKLLHDLHRSLMPPGSESDIETDASA
ncbi:DNA-binding protein [Rathayibacter soli]|uniref:DNA-binding protein n=1 Tax=Rathayibacter soli TaxID=3144168 RepID=UPI0027E3DD9B|nr:DNA-binding protein [Glaciibacter superstes]